MPNWNPNGYSYDFIEQTPDRLPGGKEMYEAILRQFRNGLPQDIVNMYLRQGKGAIGANLREGQQELKESLASSGNATSVDALVSGLTKQYGESGKANVALTDNLADRNYAAQMDAFQKYLSLTEGFGRSADRANQYKMNILNNETQKTMYADGSDFDIGSAIGGVAQAAGTVGGAALSSGATCFCYAEAFGTSSREFLKARDWAMRNATNYEMKGYMKLSTILIPKMRRFPKFKQWFKEAIALPALEQMKTEDPRLLLIALRKLCAFLGRNFDLSLKDALILKSVFKANDANKTKSL